MGRPWKRDGSRDRDHDARKRSVGDKWNNEELIEFFLRRSTLSHSLYPEGLDLDDSDMHRGAQADNKKPKVGSSEEQCIRDALNERTRGVFSCSVC
jgi:hypothetical protein